MDQARRIVTEKTPDRRYRIFVLRDEEKTHGFAYKGFLHINHAFSGTTGAIVRMLWLVLAPYYDNGELDPIEVGDLLAGVLDGGVRLCQTDMKARSMKLHLGSLADSRFAAGVASGLKNSYPMIKAAVRSNWLHLDHI